MSVTESTTTDEPTLPDEPATDSAAEDEYKFTPKLSPRWALSLEQVIAVALFCVLYFTLNLLPLRVTDLWGHVMYGQWIIDHQSIPQYDPWMPLAAGMQVIDTAWLSQVIFGAVDRAFGMEALSHLFAIVNIAAYLVWTRLFYLQARRVWLSVGCTALLILIGWSRFATIRPENFAVLCFAVVCLLAVRLQRTSEADGETRSGSKPFDYWTWIGIPLVFALWANLHGSFIVGIAVLACFLLGRIVEVAWQARSLWAVLGDRSARRWLYLLELAAAATLLNPYGLDLWVSTLGFSANPNLASILEWQPLVVFGVGGRPFAVSIVLLLIIWRQSKRPIQPVEVLLLSVFGLSAMSGIRMLGWYAPVYVVVVAPHIADIVSRWLPSWGPTAEVVPAVNSNTTDSAAAGNTDEDEDEAYELPPGQSFRYSLVAVLLIWVAFALSPSSQIIFKKSRSVETLVSNDTPLKLTSYLSEAYAGEVPQDQALPGGQTFHPQWWGDWLKREGPADFRPFVTSNIHLVPPQVWRDYQRVLGLQSGWEGVMDRYNVSTIIVDRQEQPNVYRALNRSQDWSHRYEDEQSAIFVRSGDASASSRSDDSPPDPTDRSTVGEPT